MNKLLVNIIGWSLVILVFLGLIGAGLGAVMMLEDIVTYKQSLDNIIAMNCSCGGNWK